MTENKTNDAALRQTFRSMDPHHAQEIRDAYYKAVEGLRTLATALEMADAELSEPGGPLIVEHLIACEALAAMDQSRLV